MIDYGLVFAAGLFASLHCIGMCGPIVLAYALPGAVDREPTDRSSTLALHMAYNGGRVLAYALLGALVGAAGMGLRAVSGIGDYVATIGGALMIIAALCMLGLLPIPRFLAEGPASGILRQVHRTLLTRRTKGSKLLLGVLTPLLPCGILYAMLFKAAADASALQGALTMAVYGIGMAPALMMMGSVTSILSGRVRRHAATLTACTIALMGVILLMRGLHVPYLHWLMGGGGHSPACH